MEAAITALLQTPVMPHAMLAVELRAGHIIGDAFLPGVTQECFSRALSRIKHGRQWEDVYLADNVRITSNQRREFSAVVRSPVGAAQNFAFNPYDLRVTATASVFTAPPKDFRGGLVVHRLSAFLTRDIRADIYHAPGSYAFEIEVVRVGHSATAEEMLRFMAALLAP